LTVTKRADFQDPFEDQLSDFASFAPFPACFRCAPGTDDSLCRDHLETHLRQLLQSRDIGAILVEPIQGRGGEIIPPDWFLPLLRTLADETGALLIFDEIYTGFHRTGKWFACEHTPARPDLICLGKALTSGFPLSACVGRADVMDAWPESTGEALHTSTFLGNPLGCRMALASLHALGTMASTEIETKGDFLLKELNGLCSNSIYFRQARGRGLLAGVDVVDAAKMPDARRTGRLIEAALARGLILLGGGLKGNVLSFTPPFCISENELRHAVQVLSELTD
jgi:4-aminobutyrate aminotransferase-like enzyme